MPNISKSRKAFCEVCGHGVYNMEKHIQSEDHKRNVRSDTQRAQEKKKQPKLLGERANAQEKTRGDERANREEKPTVSERASNVENPKDQERARI